MAKILVSGLINIETTCKVEGFPLEYSPVNYNFFGNKTTVSGVGYNIAKALDMLGNDVSLLSITGRDFSGKIVEDGLNEININTCFIERIIDETPQSVILFEPSGRRSIHVDLKNLQETDYPGEKFLKVLDHSDLCVLANINFSRKFLKPAKDKNKIIATDVHVISDLNDSYNRDFMKYADILFMSDEKLPCSPEEWAKKVSDEFGTKIVVIGLGAKGALLHIKENNYFSRFPAVTTRPVINTIGAGDSLFSAFIHNYAKTSNPVESIKKAILFASYKIGANGGAEGFLTEDKLEELYKKHYM